MKHLLWLTIAAASVVLGVLIIQDNATTLADARTATLTVDGAACNTVDPVDHIRNYAAAMTDALDDLGDNAPPSTPKPPATGCPPDR